MRNSFMIVCASLLLLASAFWMTMVASETGEAVVEPADSAASVMPCSHKESEFCTHLPLVVITTDGRYIQKEETIWAEVAVIDNAIGKNHLDDVPTFTTASTIKYRGNSSYTTFDKKQYRLEFYRREGGSAKQNISVMGMAQECDWVLYGPFLDRSLIRNHLLYAISRELMEWAPNTRFCEVVLDGEYLGVYLMTESVKVSANRILARTTGLLSGETTYLLKRERPETEINVIRTYGTIAAKTWHELSISYPNANRLLDSQKEWIRNDVSEFERVLFSNHFADPKRGYAAYIDIESFIDYYLINEFAMITDAGFLSTYVYKDMGGKLKMTVWDFNNAFDNYPWYPLDVHRFVVAESNWYSELFRDKGFTDRVVARYLELRQGVLSDETLFGRIDEAVAELDDAVRRNFEVWGYTFFERLLSRDANGISRDPRNYDEAVQLLKDTIQKRGAFLDYNIQILYQYAINR